MAGTLRRTRMYCRPCGIMIGSLVGDYHAGRVGETDEGNDEETHGGDGGERGETDSAGVAILSSLRKVTDGTGASSVSLQRVRVHALFWTGFGGGGDHDGY